MLGLIHAIREYEHKMKASFGVWPDWLQNYFTCGLIDIVALESCEGA